MATFTIRDRSAIDAVVSVRQQAEKTQDIKTAKKVVKDPNYKPSNRPAMKCRKGIHEMTADNLGIKRTKGRVIRYCRPCENQTVRDRRKREYIPAEMRRRLLESYREHTGDRDG